MDEHDRVTPINFTEERIGKLVPMSKRRYAWSFEHDSRVHILKLTMSLFSSKFMVNFDQSFSENGIRSLFDPFLFESVICGFSFRIIERNLNYEFYINKQLFQVGCQIDFRRETTHIYLKSKQAIESERTETSHKNTNYLIFDKVSKTDRDKNKSRSIPKDRYLSSLYNEKGEQPSKNMNGEIRRNNLQFGDSHAYEKMADSFADTEFYDLVDERVKILCELYKR